VLEKGEGAFMAKRMVREKEIEDRRGKKLPE